MEKQPSLKYLLTVLTLVFGLSELSAQQDTLRKDSLVQYVSEHRNDILDAIIINGDTIPIMVLDEVLLVDKPSFNNNEARRRYYILKRMVIKVYPYAIIAGNKLDSLNLLLEDASGLFARRRLTKDFQEYLEGKFEDELKALTHREGQILSKLIYRETGMTTYDLISEYRSGWNAFWWNVVANFNEISLKTPYNPAEVEEDKLIETILRRAIVEGRLKEREPITEL